MYTFFSSRRSGSKFYISGEDLKHLRVRRIRIGEEIGLIHEGRIYRCVLKNVKKNEAECELVEEIDQRQPGVKITLFQSVPNDLKTLDFIVQKATEIGVESIVLTITERSFQMVDPITKRKERWKRIVREAMKQSNRPTELKIHGPVKVESIRPEEDVRIALHLSRNARSLSTLKVEKEKSFALAVGPEGGFSKRDLEILENLGFTTFSLDTYILRTETAAIVAAGFIVILGGP